MKIPLRFPRWECHRVVGAARILKITAVPLPHFTEATCKALLGQGCGTCQRCKYYAEHPTGPGSNLELKDCGTVAVSGEFLQAQRPVVGGYYIVEADGQARYMAAATFEATFHAVNARAGRPHASDTKGAADV